MPATRAPIYKRSPSAPRPRPVSRSQVSHVPVAGPVGFRCSAGRGRPTRPPPKSRSLGDTCSVIPARPAQPPPKPRSLGDTCSVIPAQPAQPPPKPRSRGGRTLAALLGRSLTPFSLAAVLASPASASRPPLRVPPRSRTSRLPSLAVRALRALTASLARSSWPAGHSEVRAGRLGYL